MPDWYLATEMVFVGLVGGLLGGFLGIAGSVLFIPAMVFLGGLDYHTAQASALVVNVCVGASGVYGHWKSGKVMPEMLRVLIPCAMVASVAGVLVSNLFTAEDQVWLRRIFGLSVAYVWGVNFYRLIRTLRPRTDGDPPWLRGGPRLDMLRVGFVGVLMGSAAGLLGISGGTVVVPAQQVVLGLRIRTAAANSAVAVIFASLLAGVVKFWTAPAGLDAHQAMSYAALLIPPAAIGSFIGSHVTHKVRRNVVRIAFLALLVWTIYKMLLG
jgi:uncharacterized membrane protein YfcA